MPDQGRLTNHIHLVTETHSRCSDECRLHLERGPRQGRGAEGLAPVEVAFSSSSSLTEFLLNSVGICTFRNKGRAAHAERRPRRLLVAAQRAQAAE